MGFSGETDSFRKHRLTGPNGRHGRVLRSRRRKTRAVRKGLILYEGTSGKNETSRGYGEISKQRFRRAGPSAVDRRRKRFVCGRRDGKNHRLTWARATAVTVATARNIFLLATMFVLLAAAAIWTGLWKRIRRLFVVVRRTSSVVVLWTTSRRRPYLYADRARGNRERSKQHNRQMIGHTYRRDL